jgi:hypothetical protein
MTAGAQRVDHRPGGQEMTKPQVPRGHDGAGNWRLKLRHRPGRSAGTGRAVMLAGLAGDAID